MSWRGRDSAAATTLALVLALAACRPSAPEPAALDTRNDACQTCRMTVSDARFAAQLVAPGEEARFFDDIGCLAAYVGRHAGDLERATAYVADHRTRGWVPAVHAIFVRAPGVETPMESHVLAYSNASSREADPDAGGGVTVAAKDLFGAKGPPAAGLAGAVR